MTVRTLPPPWSRARLLLPAPNYSGCLQEIILLLLPALKLKHQRYARRQFGGIDRVGRIFAENDQHRAQRVAVRGEKNVFARLYQRLDVRAVIRLHARNNVLQTLAARRRDVVAAAPDMHLLFAVFLAR